MRATYHPAARAELRRAARWYEEKRPGIGVAFLDAVRSAEGQVCEYPQSGAPIGGANRRCLVPRFPYGLVYRADGDDLFILAVAHVRRHPDYWRGRE